MKERKWGSSRISILILTVAGTLSAAGGQVGKPDQHAQRILDATGVKGGLIVHIGCGDGVLTAALGANDRYLVHGLDTNAANVRRAQEHIQSLGQYGRVSASQFSGQRLPYVGNLVNLVVSEDLGGVPMSEVMRVLVPFTASRKPTSR